MTVTRAQPLPYAVLGAGCVAAVVSVLALGILAAIAGKPVWMPLNVSTQAFFGPEVARIQAFDLSHTVFGLLIHVASCFFWALVAVLVRVRVGSTAVAAWGTALLALVVDYGILPERLSPGWHLVLSFPAVICGFLALGLGLWLGLLPRASAPGPRQEPPSMQMNTDVTRTDDPAPETGPEALRHPNPKVVDQRQQRIDPTNKVTDDPNEHGDLNRKQPGGGRRDA